MRFALGQRSQKTISNIQIAGELGVFGDVLEAQFRLCGPSIAGLPICVVGSWLRWAAVKGGAMMFTTRRSMETDALRLVEASTGGILVDDIYRYLQAKHPRFNAKELSRILAGLEERYADRVQQLPNGTIVALGPFEDSGIEVREPTGNLEDESDFYDSCGDYLMRHKWVDQYVLTDDVLAPFWINNPDIVGSKSVPGDQGFATISVELKTVSDNESIRKGFTQALAYSVHSDISFLAVPALSGDRSDMLHAQCFYHGVGLVFFEVSKQPDFRLQIPPRSSRPDVRVSRIYFDHLRKVAAQKFATLFPKEE